MKCLGTVKAGLCPGHSLSAVEEIISPWCHPNSCCTEHLFNVFQSVTATTNNLYSTNLPPILSAPPPPVISPRWAFHPPPNLMGRSYLESPPCVVLNVPDGEMGTCGWRHQGSECQPHSPRPVMDWRLDPSCPQRGIPPNIIIPHPKLARSCFTAATLDWAIGDMGPHWLVGWYHCCGLFHWPRWDYLLHAARYKVDSWVTRDWQWACISSLSYPSAFPPRNYTKLLFDPNSYWLLHSPLLVRNEFLFRSTI